MLIPAEGTLWLEVLDYATALGLLVAIAVAVPHPGHRGPTVQPARYHAARTIESFSARLRDEVDLDTLSAEVLAVVDQTMEPTRASLWLRPPMERSGHSIH